MTPVKTVPSRHLVILIHILLVSIVSINSLPPVVSAFRYFSLILIYFSRVNQSFPIESKCTLHSPFFLSLCIFQFTRLHFNLFTTVIFLCDSFLLSDFATTCDITCISLLLLLLASQFAFLLTGSLWARFHLLISLVESSRWALSRMLLHLCLFSSFLFFSPPPSTFSPPLLPC